MAAASVPPIGSRLRAARRLRGISVRGLAREIGVSASLISQIETEKSSPSVSTLYAITTALDISIEDLFGDPGPDAAAAPEVDDDEPADELDVPALEVPLPAVLAAAVVGEGRMPLPVPAARSAASSAARSATHSAAHSAAHPVSSGRDRRIGPVITPELREVLTLDSGVTWELLGQIPNTHVDFLLITYQPGGGSSSSGLLMRHSGTEFGYVISGELTLTLGFETRRLRAGDSVSFESSTPHAYRNESTEPAVGVWFVLERSA